MGQVGMRSFRFVTTNYINREVERTNSDESGPKAVTGFGDMCEL